MKQLTTTNSPSDDTIAKLFYSTAAEDNRLASIFIIKKYRYPQNINESLEKISRNYRIKKGYHVIDGSPSTYHHTVRVYVDTEAFVQIIVGSYGIWCKSLATMPVQQTNTVIEFI